MVGLRATRNDETELQDTGNGITGYSQTTVMIPQRIIVDGRNDEMLVVWTPDAESGMHTSEIKVATRLVAHAHGTEGAKSATITIGMDRDPEERTAAAHEQDEIKEIIGRLVKLAIQDQPEDLRTYAQARMAKGRGWDVIESEAPVIESVTWQSVYNMMEYHAVGIKIHEGEGMTAHKQMRKEL